MKLADLTQGSFYAYFNSRDALVVEALALAMDRTVAHWLDLTHGLLAGGFDQRQVSWLAGRRVLLSFPDPKIQWQMSRKLAAYSCGAAAALGTSPHRIPF